MPDRIIPYNERADLLAGHIEQAMPLLVRGEYRAVAREILGPPVTIVGKTRHARRDLLDHERQQRARAQRRAWAWATLAALSALIGLAVGIDAATPARPIPLPAVTVRPPNTAELGRYTERTLQDDAPPPPELTFRVQWDPMRSCVSDVDFMVRNFAPLRTDNGDPILRVEVPKEARCEVLAGDPPPALPIEVPEVVGGER